MNRRTFLTSMLAACAAPAIVRADSLMRIVPRDTMIIGYDLATEDSHSVLWVSRKGLHEYYGGAIRRMSRELADAIDRDILESFTGNRLTLEFEAPKFPSVASSLVQRKQ